MVAGRRAGRARLVGQRGRPWLGSVSLSGGRVMSHGAHRTGGLGFVGWVVVRESSRTVVCTWVGQSGGWSGTSGGSQTGQAGRADRIEWASRNVSARLGMSGPRPGTVCRLAGGGKPGCGRSFGPGRTRSSSGLHWVGLSGGAGVHWAATGCVGLSAGAGWCGLARRSAGARRVRQVGAKRCPGSACRLLGRSGPSEGAGGGLRACRGLSVGIGRAGLSGGEVLA